ncbi:sulfotransferase sult [Holotrichia oblita]|uniref:Sulfotransferase sult n=1 Tax=Holotrichia oblita TaxID=644536 RepID=A0ACB9SSC5_HOLOL|nr:sulfotransferase sult [Holotrichia oblita]
MSNTIVYDEPVTDKRTWSVSSSTQQRQFFNAGKNSTPIEYTTVAQDILENEVRKDDVWLLGYPRVGQTWCQEVIWLIVNNLNFNLARSTIQHLRAPKLEQSLYKDEIFDKIYGCSSIQYVKSLRSPRTIRSHLPLHLLPTQLKTIRPKIIYMTRNPKDIWCSYYSLLQAFFDYDKSFEDASVLFCDGKMSVGCPIEHALPFWNRRNEPHVLFLNYEDARINSKATIKLIADFLDRPLKLKQIVEINKFVSLESMKMNPAVNMEWYLRELKNGNSEYSFIGDGIVGNWRNNMTVKVSRMFDDWISAKTEGTGLRFIYE